MSKNVFFDLPKTLEIKGKIKRKKLNTDSNNNNDDDDDDDDDDDYDSDVVKEYKKTINEKDINIDDINTDSDDNVSMHSDDDGNSSFFNIPSRFGRKKALIYRSIEKIPIHEYEDLLKISKLYLQSEIDLLDEKNKELVNKNYKSLSSKEDDDYYNTLIKIPREYYLQLLKWNRKHVKFEFNNVIKEESRNDNKNKKIFRDKKEEYDKKLKEIKRQKKIMKLINRHHMLMEEEQGISYDKSGTKFRYVTFK
jgi:hypothetical protein